MDLWLLRIGNQNLSSKSLGWERFSPVWQHRQWPFFPRVAVDRALLRSSRRQLSMCPRRQPLRKCYATRAALRPCRARGAFFLSVPATSSWETTPSVIMEKKRAVPKALNGRPFYTACAIADFALDFLEEAVSQADPFLLYVVFSAPSLPSSIAGNRHAPTAGNI